MPQEASVGRYECSQSYSFDCRSKFFERKFFERNFHPRLSHLNFITFKEIS
jgi:hypothetical protein